MDVAVVDPLPLFRLGALIALGCGIPLASVSEMRAWLERTDTRAVVLLTLDGEDSWSGLEFACAHPHVLTVAVLPSSGVAMAARALRAGAAHIVPRDADPDSLRRVVDEVAADTVSLPLAVLRAATALSRDEPGRQTPGDDELSWLRALAGGSTVQTIARSAGYSERMLYRRLRELYRRLGVSTRTQALILARDAGWL